MLFGWVAIGKQKSSATVARRVTAQFSIFHLCFSLYCYIDKIVRRHSKSNRKERGKKMITMHNIYLLEFNADKDGVY